MKRFAGSLLSLGIVCLILVSRSHSQDERGDSEALRSSAPRVYIDCDRCDIDFIRTEITFVNYVRDRKEAQVHILITTQRTGSGGTEYTVTFIGQRDYAGMNDTLKFVSKQTDTEDQIRRGIVRVLKMGLVRYVAKTPLADQISISFRRQARPTPVEDRWDNWVFNIELNSFLRGEKANKSIRLHGSLSANRITPDLKIRSSLYASYNESKFELEDSTISSLSRNQGLWGLAVKSIDDHFSAGISWSVYSSTYDNTKLAFSLAPAIEYNLFPYSESTRRELRFLYRVGYRSSRYNEETIFDKTSEILFNEVLSVTLEVKQTWGSVSATLEGSHYFHDFSKNRLQLSSNLSLHLFKGLSLRLSGRISMIHDQLSLPKREATPEEVLLRRTQLATQYKYRGSVGLSYTFGSIYKNVVNPRFGD
mgnify:CR=1 FL=1